MSFKSRWGITSNFQVAVIVAVFAVTGSSAAFVSKPILAFFGITKQEVSPWLYYFLYILLIFPAYQVLLVAIGTIFGQFRFFWALEKKVLRAIGLGFLLPKNQHYRRRG